MSSAVRVLPDWESWDFELINKIIGTLLNPKGAGQADRGEVEVKVIPVDRTLVHGQTEQPMDQRPE